MTHLPYTRFSIYEREIIYKRLAEGVSQKSIAEELDRNPSSISREIRRSGMNQSTYRPSIGEEHANDQAVKRKRKYKLFENKELADFVLEKLLERWSPEQISGAFKRHFPNTPELHVSHETIYRYIYAIEDKALRELHISCLRQGRKRRRVKKTKGKKRSSIKDPVSIHDRPEDVLARKIPGNWEGDRIIGRGRKSFIGTIVERTTGFTIIVIFRKGECSTKAICKGFAAALGVLPAHMKKSLTYDRGTEMAAHKWFKEITGIPVFFADPYSSWQRGTNENTNGLIRDYFPKKTDFRDITEEQLLFVQDALNNRPRKRLKFAAPAEAFYWLMENPGATIDDFHSKKREA